MYRHSFEVLLLVLGVLVVFLLFIGLTKTDTIVLAATGIAAMLPLIYFVIAHSASIIVTDSDITSKTPLSQKTLTWGEIQQVSERVGLLRLRNSDGDVTIPISSYLPGFDEIVEMIGEKRSDLFATQEFSEIDSGLRFFIPLGLLIILVGSLLVFLIFLLQTATKIPADTLTPIGSLFILILFILGMSLSTPQSISQNGRTLSIKYLWREKALSADEIEAVELAYQSTRNGRVYYPVLNLKNGKIMRIPGLKVGSAVMYLVLTEWHKRQTDARFSV